MFLLDIDGITKTDYGFVKGKSTASIGGNFITPSDISSGDVLELTLKSKNQKTPNIGGFYVSSDKIAMSYSGATTGNNQIIAALTKLDNENSYNQYAKLVDTSANDSSSKGVDDKYSDGINISASSLADGSQTIYLYGEQANGLGFTDYASDPDTWQELQVAVASGNFNKFTLGSKYTTTSYPVTVDNGGVLALLGNNTYAQSINLLSGGTLMIDEALVKLSGALTMASGSILDFVPPSNMQSNDAMLISSLDLSGKTVNTDLSKLDLASLVSGTTIKLISGTVSNKDSATLQINGTADTKITENIDNKIVHALKFSYRR